jgi:hypothetical protein
VLGRSGDLVTGKARMGAQVVIAVLRSSTEQI